MRMYAIVELECLEKGTAALIMERERSSFLGCDPGTNNTAHIERIHINTGTILQQTTMMPNFNFGHALGSLSEP